MDAPDELRQAARAAAQAAMQSWKASDVPDDVSAWDHFYQHIADAVLAVPGIADALARDAKVAEIVAAGRFPGGVSIHATEALRIAALYPEAGK